jgi:hypothetical protein
MTIVDIRQVNLKRRNDDEEEIGAQLCLASLMHFGSVLGQTGIGLSYQSCNAALAVNPKFGFPGTHAFGGSPFGIVFGSSRLYQGLDPVFNQVGNITNSPYSSSQREQHAEQSAILSAESEGCTLWDHGGHAHLYVDFEPCPNCYPWLDDAPINVFVHYKEPLDNQSELIKKKKELRREQFGRITEKRVYF